MRISNEDYKAMPARHPALLPTGGSFGSKGIFAIKSEPAKRPSLEHPVQGEAKGSRRFKILFTVYARRPLDWDNYRFKELQDMLVHAGLIPDDKWNILNGCIESYKVHRKEEERTEVRIEPT